MDTITSTSLTPTVTPLDGTAPRACAQGEAAEDRAFAEALDREIAQVLAETLGMPTDLAQAGLPAIPTEEKAALEGSKFVDPAAVSPGADILQTVEATAAELARDTAALALHANPAAQPEHAAALEAQDTSPEPASVLMGSIGEALGKRELREPQGTRDVEERAPAHAGEPDLPAAAPLLAVVAPERLASAEVALSASSEAATPLDSLASAALASKWAPVQQGRSETASAPATARVETPLGTDGWGEAFQQKIIWLVDREQQSAELHVNPPHLGPVDVMLDLADSGAHIAFSSPHAAVREAIEASLSDLRNALAERGVALGGAHVSADPGSAREQLQQEQGARASGQSRAGSGGPVAAQLPTVDVRSRTTQVGLVDIFA